MMATTHRTGSIAAASAVLALVPAIHTIPKPISDFIWLPTSYDLTASIIFLIASLWGGLFPDADIPSSVAGKKLRFVLLPFYLLKKILSIFGIIIRPLKKISTAMGHRGIFHSPLFHTILFAVLSALLYSQTGLQLSFLRCALSGLYLGVLTHLLLDYISGGIPIYAPFSMKRHKPAITIKTGSYLEILFIVLFLIICVYMTFIYVRSAAS